MRVASLGRSNVSKSVALAGLCDVLIKQSDNFIHTLLLVRYSCRCDLFRTDHDRRGLVAGMGNPSKEKPLDLAELQRQLQSLFDDESDVEVTGTEEGHTAKDKAPGGWGSASPRRSRARRSPLPGRRGGDKAE